MLEVSANSAATLLYSIISGADDTSSYQYSFSTYEDGVVHSKDDATGTSTDDFSITFPNSGVHAIAVEMKSTDTGATVTEYVLAHVYKQGSNSIHMGRQVLRVA